MQAFVRANAIRGVILVVASVVWGCDDEAGADRTPSGGDASAVGDASGGENGDGGAGIDGEAEGDAASGGAGDGQDDSADASPVEPLALGVEPHCNPLASSAECLFPYPSRFFQVADGLAPSGYRNALRNDAVSLPPGAPELDFEAFNQYDGHSPAAPLVVHFGVDVHPDLLVDLEHTADSLAPDAPIALFDLGTGERVPLLTEMDQTFRTPGFEDRHALLVRPMAPMRMGARHLAVFTADLVNAEGIPLTAPAGFAALRDGIPTDHAALEAARADYEELFAFADAHGYPRGELLLAFDFQVASKQWVLGGILSMREQARAETGGQGLGYTIASVEENPNENVRFLVEGTFEVPRFLDDANRLPRALDGSVTYDGATESYPFTMIIPKRAEEGEPLPLVVFGHGIFGTATEYLHGGIGKGYIQPLAQNVGGVVIATNFIGLSGADQELIASSVVADLDNVHVITDRLQQSLINNLTLIEVARAKIQHDLQLTLGDGPLLANETYYYGVSLGGVQGVSLTALSPDITRAVAAVPGGAWSTMLPRSVVYSPFKGIVDAVYPDPLLHQVFFSLLQSRFDGSDGVNVGILLEREPPAWAPADRRIILLEAIGDCQVPNIATRMVARAIGLAQLTPAVEPVWGLTAVAAPVASSALAQILMPDRLENYTPPIDNTMPSEDNGTHSDAIVLPPAFAQLEHFFVTGEVAQFCDGPCDPE